MARARNFCFTINNYTEEDKNVVENIECKYIIYGFEKGKKETPHIQGYIEFKNARTVKGLSKSLKRASIRIAKGTGDENFEYCSKSGVFFERGKKKEQGERKDLVELKDEIIKGLDLDELILDDPMSFHQYGRTLERITDIKLRTLSRTEPTIGVWLFGPTGSGKSKRAFENYSNKTHYLWKDDKGWQDGYKQQDTVIVDDFRGNICYADILKLADRHPWFVPRRGREPMPFISKKVIITSSLRPEEVYNNLSKNDSMEQLYRRYTVIHVGPEFDTEVVRGNNDPDLCVSDFLERGY